MTKIAKPAPEELIAAIEDRDINRVKSLLERGANPNKRPSAYANTILQVAVLSDRSGKIAKLLIENGADVDATNLNFKTTALMYAARNNNPVLELLVEKSTALDHKDQIDRTALVWATQAQNKEAERIIKKALKYQQRQVEEKAARITDEFHNIAIARQTALRNRRPKVILMP
jgi:ankyrin repeat protein